MACQCTVVVEMEGSGPETPEALQLIAERFRPSQTDDPERRKPSGEGGGPHTKGERVWLSAGFALDRLILPGPQGSGRPTTSVSHCG